VLLLLGLLLVFFFLITKNLNSVSSYSSPSCHSKSLRLSFILRRKTKILLMKYQSFVRFDLKECQVGWIELLFICECE